jgi:hypothetical protein
MIETNDLKHIPRQHHESYLNQKMGFDDWQVGNEEIDGMTEREKELSYADYMGE